MINQIVMKNVASYKAEAVLETDKKVNLIYGLRKLICQRRKVPVFQQY